VVTLAAPMLISGDFHLSRFHTFYSSHVNVMRHGNPSTNKLSRSLAPISSIAPHRIEPFAGYPHERNVMRRQILASIRRQTGATRQSHLRRLAAGGSADRPILVATPDPPLSTFGDYGAVPLLRRSTITGQGARGRRAARDVAGRNLDTGLCSASKPAATANHVDMNELTVFSKNIRLFPGAEKYGVRSMGPLRLYCTLARAAERSELEGMYHEHRKR